jgi:hypothetical protein
MFMSKHLQTLKHKTDMSKSKLKKKNENLN